jgi:hypothetical protein
LGDVALDSGPVGAGAVGAGGGAALSAVAHAVRSPAPAMTSAAIIVRTRIRRLLPAFAQKDASG